MPFRPRKFSPAMGLKECRLPKWRRQIRFQEPVADTEVRNSKQLENPDRGARLRPEVTFACRGRDLAWGEYPIAPVRLSVVVSALCVTKKQSPIAARG